MAGLSDSGPLELSSMASFSMFLACTNSSVDGLRSGLIFLFLNPQSMSSYFNGNLLKPSE